MSSFGEYMAEYKKQVQKGAIKAAYKGLMEYLMGLKSYFKNKYPEYHVPSSIYYGYLDMTYFSLFPQSLKKRQLKIAVVFIHGTFKFEVWLAGINKNVQAKYWKLIKNSNWRKYRVPPTTEGFDSIVECTLVNNPDFNDLDALTNQIEKGTLAFIKDVEAFLSENNN